MDDQVEGENTTNPLINERKVRGDVGITFLSILSIDWYCFLSPFHRETLLPTLMSFNKINVNRAEIIFFLFPCSARFIFIFIGKTEGYWKEGWSVCDLGAIFISFCFLLGATVLWPVPFTSFCPA